MSEEKKVLLPQAKLSFLWHRLFENVNGDYLEFFIITSQAAGLEPSLGRPFGVGKSTLAIWMCYRAWAYSLGKIIKTADSLVDLYNNEDKINLMKKIIDDAVAWSIDDLVNKLRDSNTVYPALIWDDVQRTAPAWQNIPPKVRLQIEYLTMTRQRVTNLIMTAPSIGDISKPLRQNITWEVIVPQRGLYEVQFIAKRRDFRNPVDNYSRMIYEVTGTFDPLPSEVDVYYKKRRDEQLSIAI
jgi:hypothetical protein